MRDLFGMVVTMPPVSPPMDDREAEENGSPPLARTVLPPGTRLITFGSRRHAPDQKATGSTCPRTAEPATFGACLDCAHCRGSAGLGLACGYA